ncbi:right-handed parallel beta-helix repeat-containing protein, partial [Candidatus Woesearchaeota archaeon]|nr:right-handed parallel beta-helix repeat-containing protein [Candidatus Woesearchaeota archaeon]
MNKNKKAELATLTAIVMTIVLVSSIVVLNQFRGITGFITLDSVSEQSIGNEIVLNFNQSGEQTIYLDLGNYTYTKASIDISFEKEMNPQLDILDNGIIDWNYSSEENSSMQTIDFLELLNDYIPNCGSYPCPVPIKITTELPGVITLNNLVLEYQTTPVEEIQDNQTNETESDSAPEEPVEEPIIEEPPITEPDNQTNETESIPPSEKIHPKVIKELKDKKRAKVIIILKQTSFTIESQQEEVLSKLDIKKKVPPIQGKAVESFDDIDFELTHKYKTTNALSGYVTKSGLKKLEADPNVEAVFIDPVLEISLTESVPLIRADQAWLKEINSNNIDGSGETICIIDTGIDSAHPDFSGKILDQHCYCTASDYGSGGCCPNNELQDSSAMDDYNHGTHVAGIAAADGALKGVAPGAGIVPIKVCDNNGDCMGSDILAGIDYCISNKDTYSISVISLSLGDQQEHTDADCTDVLDNVLLTANNQGMFIAAASGNEGYSSGINYPACLSYVTSVGATDKNDNIASITNIGSNLDLLAPGIAINSTVIGGYGLNSGTSMATPHVAGAAALIIQEKKELSQPVAPSEIENDLKANGVMIDTYERIDVLETVDSIDNSTYTITGTVCSCNSCSSCQNSLLDPACDVANLTLDITTNDTCINIALYNITNKTLACNGNTINGSDSGAIGINVSNHDNFTINNCTIIQFTNGIVLQNTTIDNIFYSTLIDNSVAGIQAHYSDNLDFSHNLVYDNGRGIYARNSHHGNYEYNNVSENNQGADYGFHMINASYSVFKHNFLYESDGQHFYFPRDTTYGGSKNLTFVNNIFTGRGAGMYIISGGGGHNISSNNFSGSSGIGIFMKCNLDHSVIKSNRFVGHPTPIAIYSGLCDSACSGTPTNITIDSNYINYTGSSQHGIAVNGIEFTIINNVINNSRASGIFSWCGSCVSGIRDTIIHNNTIINSGAGIRLGSADNMNITNNTIQYNSGTGIYITSGECTADNDNNYVYNNNMTNNTNGIYLEYVDSSSFIDNTAINSDTGIYISTGTGGAGDNNTFTGNTLYNNTDWSILHEGSCYNNIDDTNTGGNDNKPIFHRSLTPNVILQDTDAYSLVILCNSDNSYISNVTIDNAGLTSDAIHLRATDNSVVKDSTTVNSNFGIYIINGMNNSVQNNVINNIDLTGIHLAKNLNGIIYTENIENNNISDVNIGVYLTSYTSTTGNATIQNNTVYDSSSDGLYSSSLTHTNFFNNTVYNSSATGIRCRYDYSKVIENFVNNTASWGIDFEQSDHSIARDNEVYDAGGGIRIWLYATVENNLVYNTTTEDGIYMASYSNATNNTIYYSGSDGLYCNQKSHIVSNKIYNSAGEGITAYSSFNTGYVQLINNTIEYSGGTGIASYGIYNKIRNNTIKYSGSRGIWTSNDARRNNITYNKIYNSSAEGIYLQSRYNNIIGNLIHNNTDGIEIRYSADPAYNLVLDNELYNNNRGVFFYYSDYNTIRTNNISESVGWGIYTNPFSNNNLIYDNYFNNAYNARDNGSNNNWNTSINCSETNIIGGPCLGGNFWYDYYEQRNATDRNGDGFGDDFLPWSPTYSTRLQDNVQDYLPLAIIRCNDELIGDTTITAVNNLRNCTSNGLNIIEDSVSLDCNDIYITGQGTGIGINVSNVNSAEIEHCALYNFSQGIFVDNSDDAYIHYNLLLQNDIGINVTSTSDSGLIYHNYFNNTGDNNAYDAGTNDWNSSIVGNFWSDYSQADYDNSPRRDYNLSVVGGAVIEQTSASPYNVDYDPHPLAHWTWVFECGETITPLDNHKEVILNGNLYCPNSNGINIQGGVNIAFPFELPEDTITDVTIDCQQNYIRGAGSYSGISFVGTGDIDFTFKNSVIKNCIISNFSKGIEFEADADARATSIITGCLYYEDKREARNHIIRDNTITHCNKAIYFLSDEAWNKYRGIYACDDHCYAADIYDNQIIGNTLQYNQYALYFSNDPEKNDGDCDDHGGDRYAHVKGNTIRDNTIINNSYGLRVTRESARDEYAKNNLFYNNHFNNTINIDDRGNNQWNTTYNCSIPGYLTIVYGPCQGGNFWHDYNGTDNGNATLVGVPNVSGDYIGDTELPYNGSASIHNGGDYLPLLPASPPAPQIVEVQCYNDSAWINCSNMTYGINLTQIRVNCTYGENVTYLLRNVEDNDNKIDGDYTSTSGDWWYYDYNQYILDSGNWTLNVSCINAGGQDNYSENWTLPWGILVPYAVTGNRTVYNGIPFNFTAGVNCTIGECGNLNATLDPFLQDLFNSLKAFFSNAVTGAATFQTSETDGQENTTHWNLTFDGTGGGDVAYSVDVDSNGNVYVIGSGQNLISGTSSYDWWLKKFSSAGVEDTSNWNKTYGNSVYLGIPYDVSIDSNNNVYVVGAELFTAGNGYDWWIKKFSSDGTEDTANWNLTLDSGYANSRDWAWSVAFDSSNNVYVVGTYSTSSLSTDEGMWIKKFSSAGVEDTANWNLSFKQGGRSAAYSVAVDSNNNVYVAGIGNNLVSGSSGLDWWIKKFSSAGVEDTSNWNKTFSTGGTFSDIAYSVAIDSNDNVYVAGSGSNLVGSTNQDLWIKKFSSSGVEDTANWNLSFDGASSVDRIYSLAIDENDYVYIAGYGYNLISGASSGDWWIKKLHSDGTENATWNLTYDGSGGVDEAYSLAVDPNNPILYAVGQGTNLISGSSGNDWWIKRFGIEATIQPVVNISLYNPTTDKNVTQNQFFEFTVNVSCLNADCGEINVSLDPVQEDTSWNLTFGTENGDEAYDVAVDSNNDVYVVGYRNSTFVTPYWWLKKFYANGTEDGVNWNKSLSQLYSHAAKGIAIDSNDNIFVVGDANSKWRIKKFDPDGNENTTHWNLSFSMSSWDIAESAALDSNNSLYVVGCTNCGGSDDSDWWLKKIYANGTEDTANWDKTFDGNSSYERAFDVVVDSNNNVYVVGIGSDTTPTPYYYQWWIKKFYPNGTEYITNWNKSFYLPFSTSNFAYSAAVDSNDNLYVVGRDDGDWQIKKYYPNGTEDTAWDMTFAAGGFDVARSVVIDSSDNVYVVGFGDNIISGSSEGDWWIKKFYPNATEDTSDWDISFDGVGDDDFAYAAALDNTGYSLYVAGSGQNLISGTSDEDWWIKKFINISAPLPGVKTGLISTIPGTIPFYTNKSSNPYPITLNAGQSQLVTFWVNATGPVGLTWEFFADANITSNMSINDDTNRVNITIVVPVNNPPTQGIPILNSSYGNNGTNENLTVYNQSTSDPDGDPVKNIINWYRNDTSITLLNMPFEGGSNFTYTKDYSGNGYDGDVNGDPAWGPSIGYDGKGTYEFDGDNDYIDVQNYFTQDIGTGDFSITAWIKTTVSPSYMGVIVERSSSYATNGKGFNLNLKDGNVESGIGDGNAGDFVNVDSGKNVSDGNWHHIAVTWNRDGNMTQYVDGIEEKTTDISSVNGDISQSTHYLKIATFESINLFFNGTIDEVMIFNRVLSPEQILALNNSRTDLIVSQETEIGDVWKACITPNDGSQDGDENCSNNLTILAPIQQPTNITVTKTDNPDPVNNDSLLNYTITLDITGNATNVTVTELYDPNVTYQSASPAPNVSNNIWQLGNLTAGTYTINITVRANITAGTTILTNYVNVTYYNATGSELYTEANETTSISSVFSKPGIIPKGSGSPFYTTSNNPQNASDTPCLGSMTAGEQCNVTWIVIANGTPGTVWEFFSIFESVEYPAYISPQNSSIVNITILAWVEPTNLTLTKTDNPDPTYNGSLLNYTLIIDVTGNNATNVTVKEVYDPNVTFVSASPAPTSPDNTTWFLGNLTNGTTYSINITVFVNGTIANNTLLTNYANVTYYNDTGGELFDETTETTTVYTYIPPLCGNSLVNIGETCDGADLSGRVCSDFDDFTAGSLSCDSSCQINTSNCTGGTAGVCGDGIINTGETCDNVSATDYNYTDLLCTDFDTFTGGYLTCTNCLINTSYCSLVSQCGDGFINWTTEQCDDGNLDGLTCSDIDSFTGGNLTCTNDCLWNTSQCTGNPPPGFCGDGTINTGEQCDGSNITNLCPDFDNFLGGYLE